MSTEQIKSISNDKAMASTDYVKKKAPTTLSMMALVISCPWQLIQPRVREHYEIFSNQLIRMPSR
jgi:hypothetical protein